MKQSLGLLEAKGLLGAITAADAMVKSADIHVLGIEKTKGFGWMTVTICGDVGAVQAAIETGSALLKTMNLYIAEKVIPRPADGLEEVFCPRDRGTKTTYSEYKQETTNSVMTDMIAVEKVNVSLESIVEATVENDIVELSQSVEEQEANVEAKEIIAIIETKGNSVKKKAPQKTKKTK